MTQARSTPASGSAPARSAGLRPELVRLLRDMDADVLEYRRLRSLLEDQFDAALRHQGTRMQALAEDITAAVETLEARRATRVTLVHQLVGSAAVVRIETALALLPPPLCDAAAARWGVLETLVRECKERNARNGRLMTDQQAILRRVLEGEEDHTYVAA